MKNDRIQTASLVMK